MWPHVPRSAEERAGDTWPATVLIPTCLDKLRMKSREVAQELLQLPLPPAGSAPTFAPGPNPPRSAPPSSPWSTLSPSAPPQRRLCVMKRRRSKPGAREGGARCSRRPHHARAGRGGVPSWRWSRRSSGRLRTAGCKRGGSWAGGYLVEEWEARGESLPPPTPSSSACRTMWGHVPPCLRDSTPRVRPTWGPCDLHPSTGSG